MSDEIKGDDMDSRQQKARDIITGIIDCGKDKRVPNLTNLSMEEKEDITNAVMARATDMLMKTYISLGICGGASIGAQDVKTGIKYMLHFKALPANV